MLSSLEGGSFGLFVTVYFFVACSKFIRFLESPETVIFVLLGVSDLTRATTFFAYLSLYLFAVLDAVFEPFLFAAAELIVCRLFALVPLSSLSESL